MLLIMAEACFVSGLILAKHAFKSTSSSFLLSFAGLALCSRIVPRKFLKLIEAFSVSGFDYELSTLVI